MTAFGRETRATIRRRIGSLMGAMVYGTCSAGASGSFTAPFVQTYADNTERLVGGLAAIVEGTGAGQQRLVLTTTQSSGLATVSPNWTTAPDSTSVVEVWARGLTPDEVNNQINLAILDVQELVWVPARLNPSALDATNGNFVTLDDTLIAVYGLRAQTVGSTFITSYKMAQDVAFLDEHPQAVALQGADLWLKPPLDPSTPLASIWVLGYTLPGTLDTDAAVSDVRSDYLVFKAAALLEASQAGSVAVDPEDHGGRAANWLREALDIRARLATALEPDTQEVLP